MGAYALLLSHACISVLLLIGWWLPARIKDRIAIAAALVGVIAGAATFALHDSDEMWRAVALDGSTTAIAAVAVACAWLVVVVLDLGPSRYVTAAFTGVGATGLSMFASNEWSVPALLFWGVGSVAIAALIFRAGGERALPLTALIASDALLFAVLVWQALDKDTWALPSPATGAAFWLAVAAGAVRAGSIPRIGPWTLLGTPAAPAVALLAGGGAVLAAEVGGRPQPWLASGLLAVATAIAIGAVFRSGISLGVAAAWPAGLAVAAMYVGSDAVAVGGIAVVASASVYALWSDRAAVSIEGASAISLVPSTVGFSAVAVAATEAFFRTDLAGSTEDKAPWVLVAALLPVALAASFACAARIGRSSLTVERPRRSVLWGLRALLAASLLVGGAATTTGDLGAPSVRELSLLIVAGLAAGAAALVTLRRKREIGEVAVDAVRLPIEPLRLPRRIARSSALMAIALALASVAGLGYLTYEGLRQGFL